MNVIQNPREDGEYITGLARGLSVLRAFSRDKPDLSLSEIAALTNLNPAVVRRCLNTLVHLGYVGQRGRRFQLRLEVMVFASAFLESMKLKELVESHLLQIRDKTGDSVSMAMRVGEDIVYLVHIPTNRMVRLAAGIGTRLPAKSTALGQVLLAHGGSASSPEVQKVRRSGYAVVQNELDSGLTTIAVPILHDGGRLYAAIGCAAVPSRQSQSAIVKSRLPILGLARERVEMDLKRYPVLADAAL